MKTGKIYGGLVMAAAALLCLAGCKKDEEGEKIMLGTQFEKAVSAQKTYLGENNTVCWSEGDKVNVNGTPCEVGDGYVEVEESETGYAAVYPATGTLNGVGNACTGGSVVIPATQTYTLDAQNNKQVLNGPMAARLDSKSGKLSFRNLYSLLKVTVAADDKNFTVNSITVTATGDNAKALTGSYDFTFNGATTTEATSAPTVGEITSGSNSVTLTCGTAGVKVTENTDQDFYIVVHPLTTAQKLTVKVNGVLDNKMVVYTYNTLSARTLNRSRIGGLAVNLQQLTAEPGSIGRFNVGTEGTPKYVTFATGNLQYLASTQAWRFADKQWDFIGDVEGNANEKAYNREQQTAWIDLFRFIATGLAYKEKSYPNPKEKSDEKYMPYEITTYKDNLYNAAGEKSTQPGEFTGTILDWGTAYNQKNGTTGWRTLTKAEAENLLNNHGYLYVKITDVKVNNKDLYGYLIPPEGKEKISSINSIAVEYTTDEIPSGYLFLPATGFQVTDGSASMQGQYGFLQYNHQQFAYWTSTSTSSGRMAFRANKETPVIEIIGHGHASAAVRLVKDIDIE